MIDIVTYALYAVATVMAATFAVALLKHWAAARALDAAFAELRRYRATRQW